MFSLICLGIGLLFRCFVAVGLLFCASFWFCACWRRRDVVGGCDLVLTFIVWAG